MPCGTLVALRLGVWEDRLRKERGVLPSAVLHLCFDQAKGGLLEEDEPDEEQDRKEPWPEIPTYGDGFGSFHSPEPRRCRCGKTGYAASRAAAI